MQFHYCPAAALQETKKAEEAKKAEEVKAAELEEAGDVNADDIVSNATAVRDDLNSVLSCSLPRYFKVLTPVFELKLTGMPRCCSPSARML